MTDQYGPEYIGDDEESLRRNLQAIPMGEIDTGEALEGHVAFTRSVNLGTRDDNAHYRIEMPFVVQPGWDWATIAAHAADAFWHCKAVVYDQAGLPFTVDEGGVLRETLRHQLPDAEPAPAPERHRPPEREPAPHDESGNGRPARTGGRFPHPRDMDQPEHITDDIWWDLVDTSMTGTTTDRRRPRGSTRTRRRTSCERATASRSGYVPSHRRAAVAAAAAAEAAATTADPIMSVALCFPVGGHRHLPVGADRGDC